MPEPKRNMGASVRARLLTLAKERSQTFDLLLTRYALERLLYRLVVYADKIIRSETDTKTGEEAERAIPFMKGYTVFNVAQIERLPQHYYGKPAPRSESVQRIERAESFFAATGANVVHGGSQACYVLRTDNIHMPCKDIDDFQFEGTPINETLVRDLAGGGFIAQQRNAVLVGGTGTGKTHLAIAIARSCIRSGSRGRFYNVVDLVNRLEIEKDSATWKGKPRLISSITLMPPLRT